MEAAELKRAGTDGPALAILALAMFGAAIAMSYAAWQQGLAIGWWSQPLLTTV